MSATSTSDQHVELLRQIQEISSLQDRLEQAIHSLVESQGEPSEAADYAKGLEMAMTTLKQELIRQYLECRILAAARALGVVNN